MGKRVEANGKTEMKMEAAKIPTKINVMRMVCIAIFNAIRPIKTKKAILRLAAKVGMSFGVCVCVCCCYFILLLCYTGNIIAFPPNEMILF